MAYRDTVGTGHVMSDERLGTSGKKVAVERHDEYTWIASWLADGGATVRALANRAVRLILTVWRKSRGLARDGVRHRAFGSRTPPSRARDHTNERVTWVFLVDFSTHA